MTRLNGRSRARLSARAVATLAGAMIAGVAIGTVALRTPRPSALLIRRVFEAGARAIVDEMRPHVPDTPLRERLNVPVGGSTVDVFTPAEATGPLPTVIWIHGGAWLSGSTADIRPYLRILAGHGYTTIAPSYSIAPESTYPTPICELNAILADIAVRANELNVDASRIVLAGDSAGAQLASQLVALTTTPDYAGLMDVRPALTPEQLAGAILHCGVYDLRAMAELSGLTQWGFKTALWAYTGTKDWADAVAGATMSTIDFVTRSFPPTLISGGNGDRLTRLQSQPMAAALETAGVEVTGLFWPADHAPALGHGYQFHLDREEARTTLEQTLSFLNRVTR
ncbi:alpha/beta hydrolase [Mycetocola manganoxydans]|uniref:Alpha/beta hydrolase n=1 Tax=Mycetocola manganoxydans TaxID=699879 RepID=A0A3L7A2J9_9MICO|nr:alpha/beta hydrolase [Mycetocola manganoxydans]RLP73821.1 alpha/beta hydrolase [Mycetocola manganoxydans]GHD42874.1 hypothetical protein GCM10008097_09270 [Mycetocola manganoxydans]